MKGHEINVIVYHIKDNGIVILSVIFLSFTQVFSKRPLLVIVFKCFSLLIHVYFQVLLISFLVCSYIYHARLENKVVVLY
jgi:hypothetical protein